MRKKYNTQELERRIEKIKKLILELIPDWKWQKRKTKPKALKYNKVKIVY